MKPVLPFAESLTRTVTTPGLARSLLLRRAVAALLVFAALVSALAAQRAEPEVVVFTRDVPAGSVITTDDLELKSLPSDALPQAAASSRLSIDEIAGRVSASMASQGEVVTESRLVGEALTAALVGNTTSGDLPEEAHMVPVKVSDPDIIPLLHHGDTVDIITTPDSSGTPGGPSGPVTPSPESPRPQGRRGSPGELSAGGQLIAAGGRVITAGGTDASSGRGGSGTVLIALPASQAARVAAASLQLPLALVITGDRARPAGAKER